jgi:hypothetical protein
MAESAEYAENKLNYYKSGTRELKNLLSNLSGIFENSPQRTPLGHEQLGLELVAERFGVNGRGRREK